MSARDDILARVRGATGRDATGRSADAGPPPPPDYAKEALVPARGRGTPAELVARFVTMAEEASATLDRVAGGGAVPAAVAAFLDRAGLPRAAVMAGDAALAAMPWAAAGMSVRPGVATGGDAVSVTPAVAGIAETGTLMVRSGPATPYTLNFMPDVHIAVLFAADVVGSYEDAWARLRPQGEAGAALPRTVTLITGPSRSSDIERTVTIGVHGPRRLHIVLAGRADGEAA